MKWPGMSGVGGQEPLIRGPLVTCILLLLAQPHRCARPNDHPPLTAGTVKLRPERAALTPPTVTSLRPPDKGNAKHAVGLTVRGGQSSSSNSPPVVASLSPSSVTHSSYPRGNVQRVTHQSRPASPIATAASGSRSGTTSNGQGPLGGHQSVPAPSLLGIRASPGASGTSGGYRSAHPRSAVNKRYPQYAPSGRAVPEPESRTSQSAGGWADMETEALGVVREEAAGTDVTKRKRMMADDRPPSSRGRQDTFGHSITEDFTHLESENAQHASHGRGADGVQSSLTETGHSSRTNAYPQEEVFEVDPDTLYPYWQQYDLIDASGGNYGGDSSPRDQPVREASSAVNHRGYEPRDYGQQRRIFHGQVRNDSHRDPYSHDDGGRKTTEQNATPSTVIPDRILSITEVARLKNMTEVGDLLQFLKRKGISMNQLLAFLQDKPTRRAILDFLDSPDDSATTLSPTTREPQLAEESFRGSPTHLPQSDEDHEGTLLRGISYLSTKSGETSNVHLVHKSNSNSSLSEVNRKSLLSASQEDGLDKAESLATEDEQKEPRNKKRKNNRGRKRKNKGKKNKRQRGRKGKSKKQPDLVHTTERGVNDTDEMETKLTAIPETSSTAPPTSTVPMLSTVKSGVSDLTEPPLFIQTPAVTLPPVITTVPSFAVPTSLPNSTRVNLSIQDGSSSSTTMKTDPLPSSPTPTFMPEEPAHKTSEVSILSVTVMEVPKNETGKRSGDETVPEHSEPTRKRPHHDMHGSYNGRFKTPRMEHNPPEHDPVPTIRRTEEEIERRTNFVTEQHKDDYILPIKGILIISGVMGALAVFTLVVLISYAVIKCSKKPVVNNYQVSEQKPTA